MTDKVSCVIKVEFDAAHRVIGHQNKCKYLHGHRYVLEVSVCSKILNDLGMVLDFGLIKSRTKIWIDENFDHTTILSKDDEKLGSFIEKYTGQKVFYLSVNPTAENIALYLKNFILNKILFDQVDNKNTILEYVKLNETPNCFVKV